MLSNSPKSASPIYKKIGHALPAIYSPYHMPLRRLDSERLSGSQSAFHSRYAVRVICDGKPPNERKRTPNTQFNIYELNEMSILPVEECAHGKRWRPCSCIKPPFWPPSLHPSIPNKTIHASPLPAIAMPLRTREERTLVSVKLCGHSRKTQSLLYRRFANVLLQKSFNSIRPVNVTVADRQCTMWPPLAVHH